MLRERTGRCRSATASAGHPRAARILAAVVAGHLVLTFNLGQR